jgi:lipopolysaccharide export system permease protein
MFDLIKQYKKIKNADQKIEIKTDLAMRLFMPLLSLLSVMLPAPFCLKYSRNIPIFMIYSIFIFGFICLITLCNGIYIVANNGVTSPFLCLSLLFTPLFIYTIWKHISLNKL